jgi:glycosyltransferase involved in cell wall biosynthesis
MSHVSVVIATYNRAHLLAAAVSSVEQQTYQDFDIIIADDGSTDATAELIRRYLQPSHPLYGRIQYFYQENQGKSAALNNALARTNSEWIAFLDSDDVWLTTKLEKQFQALARFPQSGACFTDYTCVNNPRMDTTGFLFHNIRLEKQVGELAESAREVLESPFVSIVTVLCRADLIRKAGAFDPGLRFTEDYDFLFRLALHGDFCFVNEPLVVVDRSPSTKRHTGVTAVWEDIEFRLSCEQYRYEQWLGLGDKLPHGLRQTIIQRLRAVHSSWANLYLERRNYVRARGAVVEAIRYQLTPNLVAKYILASLFPSTMSQLVASRRGFRTEVF